MCQWGWCWATAGGVGAEGAQGSRDSRISAPRSAIVVPLIVHRMLSLTLSAVSRDARVCLGVCANGEGGRWAGGGVGLRLGLGGYSCTQGVVIST